MKEETRKQLNKLLDQHIRILDKKIIELEDLSFILEVLEGLLSKISEDELDSLLAIDEKEFKDLEHLFKDEKEKALIHKVSGIRYLVAGIHTRHVHIDITKDQRQMIAKFLKLLQEKKNIIVPVLERDKEILEQDKTKVLLEKIEGLNAHTYLSEVDDVKRLFLEFEVPTEEQYRILYEILEHNQSVYISLKESLE